MFSLGKYCLSESPSDDYILICTYIGWDNPHADYQPPLIPDMDPVSGALLLTDTAGKIIYVLEKLVDSYYTLLIYFHMALLYDGLFKFYISRHGSLTIKVYLYKPMFNGPVHLPLINDMKSIELPLLQPSIAKNERNVHNECSGFFQLELYNYQENNIRWMINLEELTEAQCNFLEYPQIRNFGLERVQHETDTLLYNSNTHFLYTASYEDSVPNNTIHFRGGLLCDEVGLGKTFSMYGLILNTLDREIGVWSRKPTKQQLLAEMNELKETRTPIGDFTSSATLVIAPARLIKQWREELDKIMIPLHDLRVYTITSITQYRVLTAGTLCNADIVIISYRFLINNNYRKHCECDDTCALEDIYWKRIILDEGHEILSGALKTRNIRDRLYRLNTHFYWLCTGTPFPNNYISLDNYIYYLSGFTYVIGDYSYFDAATVHRFLQQNTRCNTYQNVMAQIYIPPISQTTVLLTQDPVERAMYVNATGESLRMIQLCTNILVSGVDSSIINDQVSSLEDVRERMCEYYRQEIHDCKEKILMYRTEYAATQELYNDTEDLHVIDSPDYKAYRALQKTVMRKYKRKMQEKKEMVASLKARKKLFDTFEERTKDTCAICCEELTNVVLTKCSHIFCKACMDSFINANPNNIICPLCRTRLDRTTDIGYTIEHKNVNKNSQYYKHVQKWGTKMAWLVQYLTRVLDSPDSRIIIFSQWKKMLQLVGNVLTENNINQVYIRGSAGQLAKNISRFKTSQETRVIMLSSETCSSGSNLTEASHIILLDTVNGPGSMAKAIEDQAIGRAARLGQTKIVQVVRLIMDNTIEYEFYKLNIDQENITEIQGGEGIYMGS